MTPREKLTAALHAHTCHADGDACAWAGEDYPGDGTCADVGGVGIEDAVLVWAAGIGETLTIPRPHVPHGPEGVNDDLADATYLRAAGRNIEYARCLGSNVTATVVKLLNDCAAALDARTRGAS